MQNISKPLPKPFDENRKKIAGTSNYSNKKRTDDSFVSIFNCPYETDRKSLSQLI